MEAKLDGFLVILVGCFIVQILGNLVLWLYRSDIRNDNRNDDVQDIPFVLGAVQTTVLGPTSVAFLAEVTPLYLTENMYGLLVGLGITIIAGTVILYIGEIQLRWFVCKITKTSNQLEIKWLLHKFHPKFISCS